VRQGITHSAHFAECVRIRHRRHKAKRRDRGRKKCFLSFTLAATSSSRANSWDQCVGAPKRLRRPLTPTRGLTRGWMVGVDRRCARGGARERTGRSYSTSCTRITAGPARLLPHPRPAGATEPPAHCPDTPTRTRPENLCPQSRRLAPSVTRLCAPSLGRLEGRESFRKAIEGERGRRARETSPRAGAPSRTSSYTRAHAGFE
jgi:hypothetical protein